jgi:hypothetical protein
MSVVERPAAIAANSWFAQLAAGLELAHVAQQVRQREQRGGRVAQVLAGDVGRRAAGRVEHGGRDLARVVEGERGAVAQAIEPIRPQAMSDRKSPYSLGQTITA